MSTKLFTQNAKMRKTALAHNVLLYNFGIPAFQSSTGLKTCPNAGSCAAGCYARSGAYLFSNVAKAYEYRLKVTQAPNAAELIGLELDQLERNAAKAQKRLVIRIHDSGDFYSASYQLMWYHIARAYPDVTFYAYTKQIVQSVALSSRKPSNVTLIYSLGGKQDHLVQPGDRHSRVFQTEAQLVSKGYANASNDDLIAIAPNAKIGLVYHGTKLYSNTRWSNITKETL